MKILEKEDRTLGYIFLVGVFLLLILLIIWSDPCTQENIRRWIQVTIPALIPISLFYLGDQTRKKSQQELKEQQENNYYQKSLDQILNYFSKCDFTNQQTLKSSIEFSLFCSLSTVALKEFNLEQKNRLINFLSSLNYQNNTIKDIPIFHFISFINTDLSRLRASGISFSDSDFSFCNFSKAILTFVSFVNAEMQEVDFTRAVLTCVDFTGANLDNAIFSNNHEHNRWLTGVIFQDAHMFQVDLSNLGLREVDFTKVIAHQANFSRTNLERANFTGANLTNADFTEAEISGANFTNTILDHVNFTGVRISDKTIFTNAVGKNIIADDVLITRIRAQGQSIENI